jgi:Dolichyl-phosphate-mannose-protein mannosyltransferase
MSKTDEEAMRPRRWCPVSRWGLPAALIALGASLLAFTWGTWPDPIVDFGRELYVPWRLSQGAVLYRDVSWFNGPLSPYLNSLAFRLFGASLRTLVATNLVVLAVVCGLLYRLTVSMTSRTAAAASVAAVLCLFGFAELVVVGNYNFICPYSHELTHGLLLAIATVSVMDRWFRQGRTVHVLVGGLLAGTALLTKPETSVAAVAVLVAFLACGLLTGRCPWSRLLPTAAVVAGGLGTPVMVAALLLSTALGVDGALRALVAPWSGTVNPEVGSLFFYRASSGLDQPFARALHVLTWAGMYAAVAVFIFLTAWLLRKTRAAGILGNAVGGFLAIAIIWGAHVISLYEAGAGLPVVAAIGLVTGVILCRSEGRREEGALLCGFSVLSLALLMKILLAARIYHYGFVLGLPAGLLLIIFFVGYLPGISARFGASATRIVRRAGGGLLIGGVAAALATTGHYAVGKTARIGLGPDQFRGDARAAALEDCRRVLEGRLRPGATVTVLPEGVMLNYLLRRRSPVPYVNFMPLELVLYGESSMLSALRASPPDVIVLVHKDTTEYGYPLFGADYAAEILGWVKANYAPSLLIGHEPFRKPSEFGIEVMFRYTPLPIAASTALVLATEDPNPSPCREAPDVEESARPVRV